MSVGSGQVVETVTPGSSVTHYPDNLPSYKNIQRSFWYDNRTPAPRFDHTELMVHTDKNGNWNISHLINKTVTALPNHSHTIQVSDFSGKNIQAVITPMK